MQMKNLITSADYSPEVLDSSNYDLAKYLTPFWEGNIVYNECVFPITDEDGSLSPFTLLYDATEIVSVKNYTLTETYKDGIDYALVDGKLVLLPGTSVKVIDYGYIHPADNPDKRPMEEYYPRRDGKGYEYWNEDNELSEAQIVVTYIHNDSWHAPAPRRFGSDIPKSLAKLRNNEPLRIVAMGDSITCGAKSSGNCGIPPYMDPYINLTVEALSAKFGNDRITLQNSGRGGWCSFWNEDNLRERVLEHKPDFVIIAFGMNDSSYNCAGLDDDTFRENMTGMIRRIKADYPDCEFLLLCSLYGNPLTFKAERYESHAAILREIAAQTDSVAVCDPQTIEKSLLERKDFLCFMADNMVHPNDLGMRLIAQMLVCGIDE